MSLLDRLRRWWKPAEYEDDHPLSEAERDERDPRRRADFFDEVAELGSYSPEGQPLPDPLDETRRPQD